MPSPKISIIIPNYNHAKFLKQRLDSVFNQTYQDFEVILLDDCSTDHSVDILSRYKQHPKVSHFIINEINTGSPFIQWKKGIELAKGEFIWIAESDDWAELNFLEQMLPLIDNGNVGIAFCNSNWANDKGEIKKSLSIYHENFSRSGISEIIRGLAFRNTIQNASACLLRKKCIDLNSFPIHTRASGDWIVYVQILCKSDVAYTSACLNNFRWYHYSVSTAAQLDDTYDKEDIQINKYIAQNKKLFATYNLRSIILFWLKKLDAKKKTNQLHLDENLKRYGILFYLIYLEYRLKKILSYH